MKTLKFKIEINAPKEKVWSVLWEDSTYRKWTAVFCEGSYFVGDWKEGSMMQFLTPNGDGMYSIIDQMVEKEYMAFKHLNMIKDSKVLEVDATTQEWIGAMETYRLKETNGKTILEATTDAVEKYVDYFNTTFIKALEVIKQLSEE